MEIQRFKLLYLALSSLVGELSPTFLIFVEAGDTSALSHIEIIHSMT
ncbi:hypothetical protein PROVRUST_07902 [Providencia rustigianii DSM 4541]|uniref:Uncharacterized protein n=1 Tax=Providencia rustigianii DSM 4541 TaxID=500637 RepID=D1P6I0_9GAMM|nr:hypothetical protein PROVRUST_07902 [Providencia rustigianii DSM 4541]